MKRRILAGILAGVLLMGTTAVYAETGNADGNDIITGIISTETGVKSVDEGGVQGNDADMILSYHGEEEIKVSSLQELEPGADRGVHTSSYISPYITSIKNQNPYGTCWAHAAMASAEADLWKKGLADSTIDLSEWQLAYFFYHTVEDPLGGTAGDSVTVVTDSSAEDYLDRGGNQQLATYRLATWQGVTQEEDAPYSTVYNDRTKTLDDALAYGKDAYHLENAYWVSMKDRDIVKQLIMEYGACAASYYHDSAYFNSSSQWNRSEPLAEYKPTGTSTNHAITIVGWDDNYSKDNFGTYKPSSNGAWLCKNSWGSNWSKDGLFYISYEDSPNLNGNAYFYDYGTGDNYDYNYQYDGGVGLSTYSVANAANVYTANSAETLKAVGFYTEDVQYTCTIKIYKNCTGNPVSGTLVSTQTATEPYAGFHTVVLDTPVDLNAGDTYSVVVYQTTSSGTPKVPIDVSFSWNWLTGVSSAKTGQSFISSSGSYWQDVSASGYNCRIKAYTDKRDTTTPADVKVSRITLSASTGLALTKGQTQKLTATVAPANATKKEVKWSTSNKNVATVSPSGLVTAKSAGTATITCTAQDGSGVKATCKVTVTVPVSGIQLSQTSAALTVGDTLTLTKTIYPSDATNQAVTWTSSSDAVASVDSNGKITAKTAGSAVITCKSVSDNSVVGICNVTVKAKVQTPSEIKVNKITLNKTTASVTKGKTLQLTATVTPGNATKKEVKWSTSNKNVATVSPSGLVTAKSAGTAIITCTAKDESNVKATCKITVKNPVVKVTKVTLNKTTATLAPKETLTLKATVTPTNATNKAVTWKSSNTKIATVSSSGKVTAKAAGTVTITCRAKDGSGKKATCKITVYTNTEAYVARIYTKALGRAAEPAGLKYWVGEINAKRKTPVEVAELFFFAPEFTNKKLNNTAYVKVLYRTFMGREADQGGLNYWIGRLNKGESRKSVLKAFAGCPEFKQIVKSFGL
ncbi:ig domain protein group 2 domain protein [Clostridium sp. CAG:632]|nr:ig domain protein group 2 domain protein [Clostridium sp. CAG:632]